MTTTISTANLILADELNRLLAVCLDGQAGFEAASDALAVEDAILRSELLLYSSQRREFAAELARDVEQFGAVPVSHGTVTGVLHRGLTNIRNIITGGDRCAVLAECKHNEDLTVEAYQRALGIPALPNMQAEMIHAQSQAVRRVRDRIAALYRAECPG